MAVTTQEQVSAGGVVFRRYRRQLQVALISVGDPVRWQLPKGIVDPGEPPAAAAQREVREETGLETELLGEVETIEYWYFGKTRGGQRVRYHKHVHFYLFRATGGALSDHDHEVNEARWVPLARAGERLSFANEQKVVEQARALIERLP